METIFMLFLAATSINYHAAAFRTSSVKSWCRPRQVKTTESWKLPRLQSSLFLSHSVRDAPAQKIPLASTKKIEATQQIFPLSKCSGVIFDMDGTILKPVIDFAYMRTSIHAIAAREVASGSYPPSSPSTPDVLRGDVLELYGHLSPEGRREAAAIFADVERRAIESMELADGAVDLLNYVSSDIEGGGGVGVRRRRALLTRNVHSTVEIMEGLLEEAGCKSRFDLFVARDTVPGLATKPAPDPILHICDVWDVDPGSVVMVGDSAVDDVVAGNQAGVGATVLINTGEDNCSGGKRPKHISEKKLQKNNQTNNDSWWTG